MLSTDEVKKIAHLARIELTEEEVLKFQKDLSVILDYVEELKSVNTDGLVEVSQVTGLENVFRADEVVDSPEKADILEQAPQTKNGLYQVKSIF